MARRDQIQLRRGTEAEWIAAEDANVDAEALEDGEIGLVTDETGEIQYFVVGDDEVVFSDLPKFYPGTGGGGGDGGGPVDATDVADDPTGRTYLNQTNVKANLDTADGVFSGVFGQISGLEAEMVTSTDITTIVAITQADYDLLSPPDPSTFYVIVEA